MDDARGGAEEVETRRGNVLEEREAGTFSTSGTNALILGTPHCGERRRRTRGGVWGEEGENGE